MRRLLLPYLLLAVVLTACGLPVIPTPTPTPPEETPFPTPTRVIGRPTSTPVPVLTASLPPTRAPVPGGPTYIAPFGTPIVGELGTPRPEQPTPTRLPSPTATWTATPPPVISLDPSMVVPGGRIVVRGSNWLPGQGILITLGPTVAEAADYVTTAVVLGDGRFETTFTLPDRWSHQPSLVVYARNFDSTFQASAPFTVVAPSPTPMVKGWRGEYFNNRHLQGTPVLVRDDEGIDFNWGYGAPAMGVPADNFSIRWTRSVPFTEGTYEFRVFADDGVRLYVDDKLVIDDWHIGTGKPYRGEISLLSGTHRIRLEYFEAGGSAMVKLEPWKPTVRDRGWAGEYYNNTHLSPPPVLLRFDPILDFDWGARGPDPAVQGENFSAYWTRRLTFKAGRYRFYAYTDDGVQVWVNQHKIIDEWHPAGQSTYFGDITLPEGRFDINVSFVQYLGDAWLHFWWASLSDCPEWVAEYYPNPTWSSRPLFLCYDGPLDFNWGDGSPDPRIPSDHFSARWTRLVTFAPGTYRFNANADDSVRVWLDDDKTHDEVIDVPDGQPQSNTRYFEQEKTVSVRVEYVEMGGRARVKVDWEQVSP